MEKISYSHLKLLEIKNDFYKKLLFQSPDLIFQFAISKERILTFPFLSHSVITDFNLTEEEKNGDAFMVLKSKINQDDFKLFLETIHQSKKEMKPWSHEFRSVHPVKGERWYKGVANVELENNGTYNFIGKITDVTDNKIQELKLKLSEERFQFALEASTKGVWDLDVLTKKVFYSSQSMKMIGFEEVDTIDDINKWDDRIHPLDKENYLADIQLHIDGKTSFYENSQRVLTKVGDYKWILSRGKIIERDKDNKPLRIIGTHTDISIQKDKEIELVRTLDIFSEQNSRLLNFAHIVSHNLSSHASNFKMLLDIIEDETDDDSIDEIFPYLKTSSAALSETIAHLKELVEINTNLVHNKENLNLKLYLDRVFSILSNEIILNNVKINNKISDKFTLDFNACYLESILLNFTTNAIKYAHPDRNPEISYSLGIEKNDVFLEIKDNGLGINLEKYGKKLFGMYNTFHKNDNARGIGLFITKNQVEAMGGRVEVESQVNIGTSFKIHFKNEI